MARCANLPVNIRNGDKVGGGQVVGWLPIVSQHCILDLRQLLNHYKVDEDANEAGKTGFVNFKRVVWHESFYRLLDSVSAYSKTGFSTECADTIMRHLYPLVLILSADYEEQ